MLLMFYAPANAQAVHEDMQAAHEHGHHNEIGIAFSPVYFLKEKALSFGLHFHYLHYIHESSFGMGMGFEGILDEHEHKTIGIIAAYRLVDRWTVSLSPGLTFEKESPDPAFALHFETSYEFELNDFHIGPALELAYDPEDFHISLGLHFGIGF